MCNLVHGSTTMLLRVHLAAGSTPPPTATRVNRPGCS